MRFKTRKSYGESKIPHCYFCGKIATRKNDNGLEVCYLHTKAVMEEIRCTCGSWLEQRAGKFGAYFNCINCGNVNMARAMEMKEIMVRKDAGTKRVTPSVSSSVPASSSYTSSSSYSAPKKEAVKERKEIIISSRDVEYFD